MTSRPVLILGMHRSGTSMLAGLLAAEGLFLGHRLQPGHTEAVFFQKLNEYVLREAAASWDRPEGVATLLATEPVTDYLVDYLTTSVDGPRSAEFLGVRRWASTRSLLRFAQPWGWKDPRTTLTWPLWRAVFPGCRVVHVTRHGVDVARSLQIRTEESLGEYTEQYAGRRRRYRYTPRRSNFAPSLQVADLDAGVALWEAYTTSAERAVAQLGDDAMELRYEDLLADPDAVMGRLLEFCGLAAPRTRTWAGRVDAERAFAHRNEPELVAAAERHGDRLAAHGYS